MTAAAGLKLYNTLTRAKEAFEPLDPANIRMYVCGPTVYDFAHIGNARPVIVFDVLFRLLRHLHGETHVTYVRNVTDVDDKINARALEHWTGKRALTTEIRALTDATLKQFQQDAAALGCLPPTHEPRATDYIATGDNPNDMVGIIARLIERGHAYVAEGHVLFDVASMPDYGALSRRSRDDMVAGARVEVAPYKRDPMDFVLWKPSDPETEPGWPSPWGLGRPGWHIECSAMSASLLGEVFDIHAGGLDLIFPHHENEIAQSCCAFGVKRMANYWLHNGFLQVEGAKMSKSLGNFITIRDVLKDWPGDVVRLNMLKTHYRQPIDWTVKGLEETTRTLEDWMELIVGVEPGRPADAVMGSLADDLNLPSVMAAMHQGARKAKRGDSDAAARLAGSAALLGLRVPDSIFLPRAAKAAGIDLEAVPPLVEARLEARKAKNFAESDRLRDELVAMGLEIMDGKDPLTGEPTTIWEVRR